MHNPAAWKKVLQSSTVLAWIYISLEQVLADAQDDSPWNWLLAVLNQKTLLALLPARAHAVLCY